MVVMIHTGAFVEFGYFGQTITAAGKYGVDIFFVISGFTIAKTFTYAKDYRSNLTRRLMLIVPLYWFVISVAMILWLSGTVSLPYWMQKFAAEPNLYNYFMHLGFVSYFDYRIANSVLGVEWSIPIEVFWYVCLPALIYFGKTIPRVVGMVVILIILTGILSYVSKEIFGTSQPIKWSKSPTAICFLSGWPPFLCALDWYQLWWQKHEFVFGLPSPCLLFL